MVIKALLEGCIKGVGKFHKTSIFPCSIFQCMRGVNRKEGEPNYDLFKLALKSTAQRIYPNYANVDWSGNAGEDAVAEDKNQILNSLTKEQKEKLIENCKKNPMILEKLGLQLMHE